MRDGPLVFDEPIPLAIPSAIVNDSDRIIQDFRESGLEVSLDGVYATKALSGLTDLNFWINLAQHAESYPFEHFIELLENVVGGALLNALWRVGQWAHGKVSLHILLPGKRRGIQYIIPDPPADAAAVKAIRAHYNSVYGNHANEYFWIRGGWMSADDYFDEKRRSG